MLEYPFKPLCLRWVSCHKVLTYIEYRAVSGVFRTPPSPTQLHPASVSSPRTKGEAGRYTHSPGGEGVGGGVNPVIRKTPDIGLASYSTIPLRFLPFLPPNYVTVSCRVLNTRTGNWTGHAFPHSRIPGVLSLNNSHHCCLQQFSPLLSPTILTTAVS